jgi:AcrR family transcriptional regulator
VRPDTDPIRQQLARARRDQILDAATKVFAEKGFARATTKSIAGAAGISEGTIYNYFSSKAEILVGLLSRLNETERREADLAAGLDDDPRAFFEAYLRHRLELLWPNLEALRATLPELMVNRELREAYQSEVLAPTLELGEQVFRRLIAEGKLRDFDVPLVTRAIAGTVFGLLLVSLLGDEEIGSRREDLPAVITGLIFDGIRVAAGEVPDDKNRE